MKYVQKLVREPALTLGVVAAGLSLAVLFGVPITKDQMAGIGIFIGSVFALTRYMTTPSAEVLAQEKPNGDVVAGAAADAPTGVPVDVTIRPAA